MKLSGKIFHQKGSAAMMSVLMLSMLAMLPIALLMSSNNTKETGNSLHFVQAENAARAGLVDAISWFRRKNQAVQGDVSFNPSAGDTMDASIGLVKEYPLSEGSNLWARYEIRRQQDIPGNPGYVFDPRAAHDISAKRFQNAMAADTGVAWSLECTGYVYKKLDASKVFNSTPNVVMAMSRASTEIRRLGLVLPAPAALIVSDRSSVSLQVGGLVSGGGCRILGGQSIGMAYFNMGAETLSNGMIIAGNPRDQQINIPITPYTIFGVSENDFKLLADINVSNAAQLPDVIPSNSVVYVDGDLNLMSVPKTLKGSGILYVKGNLYLPMNLQLKSIDFKGVVYLGGNLHSYGSNLTINGALIAANGIHLYNLQPNQTIDIMYDDAIINMVRSQICQYRENKSTFLVASANNK